MPRYIKIKNFGFKTNISLEESLKEIDWYINNPNENFFLHALSAIPKFSRRSRNCFSLIKYFKSQGNEIILNIVGDTNEFNLSQSKKVEITDYCKN